MGVFLLIGFKKQTNKQTKNTNCNTTLRKTSFKTYVKQLFQRVSVSYVQVTTYP